jgi:hypothetical protein
MYAYLIDEEKKRKTGLNYSGEMKKREQVR